MMRVLLALLELRWHEQMAGGMWQASVGSLGRTTLAGQDIALASAHDATTRPRKQATAMQSCNRMHGIGECFETGERDDVGVSRVLAFGPTPSQVKGTKKQGQVVATVPMQGCTVVAWWRYLYVAPFLLDSSNRFFRSRSSQGTPPHISIHSNPHTLQSQAPASHHHAASGLCLGPGPGRVVVRRAGMCFVFVCFCLCLLCVLARDRMMLSSLPVDQKAAAHLPRPIPTLKGLAFLQFSPYASTRLPVCISLPPLDRDSPPLLLPPSLPSYFPATPLISLLASTIYFSNITCANPCTGWPLILSSPSSFLQAFLAPSSFASSSSSIRTAATASTRTRGEALVRKRKKSRRR